MTRQNISTGTTANDGTGDTLRSAGQKINENFAEVYQELSAYSSSVITANGAASSTAAYIICNKASALAVSVADGTIVGECKIFTNKGAGTATITPANFAQGATFALAQYDGCQIIWDGADWYLVGNQGEVTVA
jgi:hypothetical protein